MPWENIGSVDTSDMPHEEEWILFCLGMAKNYINFVCSESTNGTRLGIMWNEHDLGNYPSLGIWYEYEEPWEYINACEETLDVFNDSVSWVKLKKHFKIQKEIKSGDLEDGYDADEEG